MKKKYLKDFFEHFTEEMIETLADIASISSFKKDSIIFYEGEQPKYLHLLVSGVASVYKTYEDGSTQVLKYFYPINLVAELANIQDIPYPASCKCEEDAKIILINYEKYIEIFSRNPLQMNYSTKCLLDSISSKLHFHVNDNNLRPMKNISIIQRISGMLLQDCDYFNRTKRWKVAHDLCISSETLSRNLKKLKTLNAIKIEKTKIIVLNKEILYNLVQSTK